MVRVVDEKSRAPSGTSSVRSLNVHLNDNLCRVVARYLFDFSLGIEGNDSFPANGQGNPGYHLVHSNAESRFIDSRRNFAGHIDRISARLLEMPRKIRELIHDLQKAGFICRGGKDSYRGSHRNFQRPNGQHATISG
uniref:Uncharacterized protein n=1 Tax=Candidatus Kentrum sp. LFY TaxID=2126342 RepID=A0A450UTY5_9GAMM|nr:MAG: hypothetical protein BECKLFY1418A_GA0070994_10552 [Candidatus Kentron sp. LFY]